MNYETLNQYTLVSALIAVFFIVLVIYFGIKKNKPGFIISMILVVIFSATAGTFQTYADKAKMKEDEQEQASIEKDQENYSDDDSDSESDSSDDSSVDDSNSEIQESSNEESKSTQESTADKLPKNVEYGYIDKGDFKKDTGMYYSKEFSYVSVGVGDHDIIKTVKFDFRDLPLLSLNDVIDYIKEWTSDDIQLKSKIDDKDYIYHSDKFDLDYEVKLTTNSKGEITKFVVYPDSSLI